VRAISAQGDVIVDLSELAFADTSLMLDLAMLARRLRVRGKAILLRDAQPQVRRLIELVGLHRLPGVRLEGPSPALA
jgi:anti-anti-sigma regulatory factor